MRRKSAQPTNPVGIANPKKGKTRRRVLKTVRSLMKIINKRADNVHKPRGRGRPPKIKVEHQPTGPEDDGVTFKQIENWFKRKWPDQRGETPDLQAAIEEEVTSGRLLVLPNRKYTLKNWRVSVRDVLPRGPEVEGQLGEAVQNGVNGSSNLLTNLLFKTEDKDAELVTGEGEQIINKRKSLPTAHHPSLVKKFKVENGEDIRLVAANGSERKSENVCGTCDKVAECGPLGQPETLLTCKDCNVSFHPSCLAYPKDLAEKASKFPWECASCKTCMVCGDAEEEKMLICDSCDRGYHMQCHDPPVSNKISSDEWLCTSCMNDSVESDKMEERAECSSNDVDEADANAEAPSVGSKASMSDKQGSESVGSQLLPTPNSSPSRTAEAEEEQRNTSSIDFPLLPKLILSVPGDPPNVTNWSVDDVHQYFSKAGFSSQADTFKNEEIDGKALLLLTRPDVLSGMKLKLGPALKIHAHIQRIQESSFPE